MVSKHIDEISEKDLQDLIDNDVLELKNIEYKETLPGSKDSDKKEFLADVSSFANAIGGDIIYGISQDRKTGYPIELKGIEIENIDNVISNLGSSTKDGIEPRILGLDIKPVKISNAKYAIIIRIPKSWISPHRVTFKGHDKFYSRSPNGKYPMDINELRVAFNLSETLIEKIKKFRLDRISELYANETPIPFIDGAKMVFHLIPLISFNPAQRYDFDEMIPYKISLEPMGAGGWNYRYNLEGLVAYAFREKSYAYTLLYRNGIVEGVNGSILNSEQEKRKLIPSISYETTAMVFLKKNLFLQKTIGVELPILGFLSFLGVKDYFLATDKEGKFDGGKIDRDILNIPEILIESYDIDPKEALKSCFDVVWNACGYSRSLNYDANGEWIGRELLY